MSGKAPADLTLLRFRPSTRHRALMVCLPDADRPAGFFGTFAEALAPSIDVLAVQYPDRWVRPWEPAREGLRERAARLVDEVRGRTDRPVLLFGHGIGAVLGFEMAVMLEQEQEKERVCGVEPMALFASGCPAPSRLGDADAAYECDEGVRVRVPIFALGGEDDARADVSDVLVWREHTEREFQIKMLPGGALFLEDNLPDVVASVTGFLQPVLGAEVIDISRRRRLSRRRRSENP
ncbi:MAG: thioesterase II family protein [Spirillospora sp.]